MIPVTILSIILIVASLALVMLALRKVGIASDDEVTGLFVFPSMPPRPRGVQETDLPRFVFHD